MNTQHVSSEERNCPVKKNILITGCSGVGKTTIILRLLERIRIDAGGFYTRELREKGKRVGFELSTLQGKTGILAHVNTKSPFKVGKYGVDIRTLEETGVEAISRAIERKILIVIDEIGKMELYSGKFRKIVIKALDSSAPVLATIGPQPIPFLNKVKSKADVLVIEVTPANRDSLPTNIHALFSGSK